MLADVLLTERVVSDDGQEVAAEKSNHPNKMADGCTSRALMGDANESNYLEVVME